jgi:hypothetical protein
MAYILAILAPGIVVTLFYVVNRGGNLMGWAISSTVYGIMGFAVLAWSLRARRAKQLAVADAKAIGAELATLSQSPAAATLRVRDTAA